MDCCNDASNLDLLRRVFFLGRGSDDEVFNDCRRGVAFVERFF